MAIAFFLVVFCIQDSAFAQQNETEALQAKVEKLQQKVSQLERKVARLEKLFLINKNTTPSSQNSLNSDGWRDKQNWRRLEKGMSKVEVKQILGEPGKINTSSYGDTWYYPDALGGSIDFDGGRVVGWSEP